MATTYNFIGANAIDQGADWFLNLTYEDSSGTPIDLTNYTAAMQLRSLPSDPTAALSLATGGQGIAITGATGEIAVHATAVQTGNLDAGTYYYDLEITSNTAVVTRLIQGQVEVSPQVTR